MHLDVRLPMGLLFLILGIILTGYGLMSDASIYQRSLGDNVNLHWGIIFMVFGGVVLLLSRKKKT